jgi:LysR family hydrogen peroxide-inducible transcriptional activator
MTLRDLEYFVALAETRHFGQAAERCHVTQPTLSMQIAKMEQELGTPLFERGKRRVGLTNAGKQILARAGSVLDGVHEIRELARGAAGELAGPLYLGVIPTVGPYLLPHLLPELKAIYPKVKLFLREDMTRYLVEQLQQSALDAAILSLPIDAHDLEHTVFFREELVAGLPLDHPLARKKSLTVTDLADDAILLLEEGNCMRDQTLNLCRGSRPIDPEGYRASSIESLRQMVSAGMGCTFLPKLSTIGPFATSTPIAIRPLHSPTPRRDIVLVYRKTYPKAASLQELAKALKKRMRPFE